MVSAEGGGEATMSHYPIKTLSVGFDDAARRTVEALKGEGFGSRRLISNSRLQTYSSKTGSDIAAKAITGTLCRSIRAAG